MEDTLKKLIASNPGALDLSSLRYPRPHDETSQQIMENAQENSYQSARALLQRLSQTMTDWRKELDDDVQPAIVAILNGGIRIDVERMAQESFHGIRIEGLLNGNPCMLLSHQSSVQLLCFVQKIEKEKPRRKIGFIIDGIETEA
jgi:queuine/archaeosine tRNA-ribosyltransferase